MPMSAEELAEAEFLEQKPVHEVRHSSKSRFYVVYSAVGNEELEGIWHCDWADLELKLPGPSLAACPRVSLRGQPSLQAALAFWRERRGDDLPVRCA